MLSPEKRRDSMRAMVTSRDGTTIGYRAVGTSGPKIILLHGGMQAGQNFTKLGGILAKDFQVFIPDRRGRGASGPYGAGYGVAKDCDDVAALIEATGATNVFGLSSGAIIGLHTALRGGITKLALYEPPLIRDNDDSHLQWAVPYEAALVDGNLPRAMVTVLKHVGDETLLKRLPCWFLERMVGVLMKSDAKKTQPQYVPIASLIPTMRYDFQIVHETANADYSALNADILLIRGTKSAHFLRRIAKELAPHLPNAEELELHGGGHVSADNDENPALVAAALKGFFSAQ